jgi:hypothetical protein
MTKLCNPCRAAEMLVELDTAIHGGIMLQGYDERKPSLGNHKVEDFAQNLALASMQNKGHARSQ